MKKTILLILTTLLIACDDKPVSVVDVALEKERKEREKRIEEGKVNRETGLTSSGCLPKDLECIKRRVIEMDEKDSFFKGPEIQDFSDDETWKRARKEAREKREAKARKEAEER